MAATPSLKVVKTTPYKGGTKVWSNRYHFSGGTPADSTHWNTLADNVKNAEYLAESGQVTITEIVCYAAGSDLPLHTFTYSRTGNYSPAGSYSLAPLECAALLRWSTDQRTIKNHPIYLFSYIHSCGHHTSGTFEQLDPAQKTLLETYVAAWVTGFSDGANTYHRAGPNGAVGATPTVGAWLTHRDFLN